MLGHSLRRTQCTPHSAHRAPPCIWTFLSSLGENGPFSILLRRMSRILALECRPPVKGHTWFLRGGRAKTKLVSKEFFARGFRTVSSRERVMGGDPCDSGRVPIVRNPRGSLLPGWSLFTPSQSHRGSPMPFNFGFCALSAKTKWDKCYQISLSLASGLRKRT